MRLFSKVLPLAVAIVIAAPTVQASAQHHFEDTLRGGTTGNAAGGSFGPDGWTITGVGDRIWYGLPRLVSGYVEFTVANITPANLPLADHEIFAMYEAGYGITEPIEYAPDFRLNHYKILMRIYGTPEPDRTGFMKLMWGMCPSGAPGHSECGCGSFFEEPFANPGPWSGAPVRMRVEWGGGTTRLLRDGALVVDVDWSGSGLTFAPQDLHLMIGSPRNDGGLSAMPIGAVFSDLVVDGTIGELATCGGVTTPDAGVPAGDAGACDSGDLAIADVTAASWQTGVFPDTSDLNVEGDGSSASAIVYMRFPSISGAASRATLTVRTSDSGSAAGGSGQVCRVDGAWDEATLTWSTRPTVSTLCVGPARRVLSSTDVSWDVTSLITGPGEPMLAIVSTDTDGAHFLSRESGGCSFGPRLDVEVAPGSDGGVVGTDAAAGVDAGTRLDGAATDAGRAVDAGGARSGGVSSGCGCSAAGGARSPMGLAVVALALWLATKRARAQR